MKTTVLFLTIALLGFLVPAEAQTDVPPSSIVVVYKQVPVTQATTLVCKDITLEQPSCEVDQTARLFSNLNVNATTVTENSDQATDKRKDYTLATSIPVQ